MEVRKQDGLEYPPKSIYALVCCFKRHFEQNGIHDINPLNVNDARFGNFRATLDAEMKRLHGKGLGANVKRAEPISSDEESMLWSSGQLGSQNAQALLNSVYYYNCKVFGLRSFDEHRSLQCAQFAKKVDEKGRVYIEYTDFGSKTNRGGLKHIKVQNKTVRHYENLEDADHCVVNLFVKYFDCIPLRDGLFYYRPLPNDNTNIPRFAKQAVGRNTLSQLISKMCKAAGIEGHKTGHSGKVTCATVLYQSDFGDQLIQERTGHRSLEALHKYKRTNSDQQYKVSMALEPKPTKNKENIDDDDDFVCRKKKPKLSPKDPDVKGMFPGSTLTNCTFNINFNH